MNFINQSIHFLKDVQSKRGHFPNKVLNWQLIGKYVGAMNKIIGNGIAQNISNKRHEVTIEFLKNEFSEYLNSYTPVKTKIDCKENSPIIWTLWLQGFDDAPDLVKVALKNTEQFALNNGFQYRFLDEETLYDYVDFPEWIIEKRKSGILTNTGLADLLRVTLLAEYGGVWVDSTVFIHKEFPISYLKKNYFTIKTGEMKDYSPNISKNRWKTFFLSGNSELFSFTRDFFFEYYKKYDLQVDYLLIDYIFELASIYNPTVKQQMFELDKTSPNLFWLQKNIDRECMNTEWTKIISDTKVFKTTYKLSDEIKCNKDNYYYHLINGDLFS